MKKQKIIILLFIFIYCNSLFAGDYPNDYGLNKDWHTIFELEKDFDLDVDNANVKFWDSLNGLLMVSSSYRENNTYYHKLHWFYRTFDGGYNWNVISKDTVFNIYNNGYNHVMYGFDIYDNGLCFGLTGYKVNKIDTLNNNIIFKSSDGGYNWEKKRLQFNDSPIKIKIYDKDTIFACFKNHLIKSTDGGKTWKDFEMDLIDVIPNEAPYQFLRYSDMDIAEDGTIFITTYHSYGHNNVLRSTDGGISWEFFALPYLWARRVKGYDKHNWLSFSDDPQFKKEALFKCDDKGSADTLVWLDFLTPYSGEVYHNGKDDIILDLGWIYAMRSTDGGQNFNFMVDTLRDNYIGTKNVGVNDKFSTVWVGKNRIMRAGLWLGALMMYDVNYNINSVKLEDIHNFQTKLYPNPVYAQNHINIEIENDKLRNIRISTYNIEGVKLDMSDEVNIPRGFYSFTYQPKLLNSGTYFIVIESNSEVIAREKFIVK